MHRSFASRLARRLTMAGAALFTVGVLSLRGRADMPLHPYGLHLTGVGVLALTVAVLLWRHTRGSSADVTRRWAHRSARHAGVASPWTTWRVAGAWAVRRKATTLRPSLAEVSWWRRLRVPTTEIAAPLARVGRTRVWSPIEDVTLRLGGPRTGKTGELMGLILDAPGAVIATSTRTDLVQVTGPLRARRGPVRVFNPSGLGGLASTVRFDPVAGCADPATATARATDMLPAPIGGAGDREFWTGQARRVLAALLHAAALGNLSMREVAAWVADPDEDRVRLHRLLRTSPNPGYATDIAQFLTTNDRTRTSITASIMPALGWLTDPVATEVTHTSTDDDVGEEAGDGLDVAELLRTRGTVFLLGAEDSQVAPLVAAVTGHIARTARQLAATMPAGRLDPPLTLALDEAALICPIPLDSWTADMGGRGVTIHIAAQSRAQLRARWGDVGAAAILNNTATLLIYGGTRDADDLTAYTTLTGDRDEATSTFDHTGRVTGHTVRRVPVVSPAQLAQLPAGRVVIIRRGMPPAIGTVTMAWRRRDVRAHARLLRRMAATARWVGRYEATTRWTADVVGRLAAATAKATARATRRTRAARGVDTTAPVGVDQVGHLAPRALPAPSPAPTPVGGSGE